MNREKEIIALLRADSRRTVVNMARELKMPVSTLFDQMMRLKKSGVIKRYAALLDYSKAGYPNVMNLVIKVSLGQKKDVVNYLMNRFNVNTLSETDKIDVLMLNTVDKSMKDYFNFKEKLQTQFNIEIVHESWVVEDLKREEFAG